MKFASQITKDRIDLSNFEKNVQDPSCGGHVLFVGTVRDRNEGKTVLRLEYDAYIPMAEKVFAEISSEAKENFGVLGCHIVHRIGLIAPGEISVVVAVSAEHRKEAFAACEYVISELKRRAPIWKKEAYRNGKSVWLEGGHHVELGR